MNYLRVNRELRKILNTAEKKDETGGTYTDKETEIFMKPVDDEFLSLPTRITNQLLYERILFVGELVQFTERELLKIPNLGRKGVFDIKHALENHNLYLKDS